MLSDTHLAAGHPPSFSPRSIPLCAKWRGPKRSALTHSLPLRTACRSVAPSFPDEHPPPAGSDEALPPALQRGSALARPGAWVPPRLCARVAWCLLPRYRRAQRRASRWCCAEENCLDLEQTGWFEQHRGSQSEKRRWKFAPGASQTLGAGGEERSAVSGMCLTGDVTLLCFIFPFELPNKSDT